MQDVSGKLGSSKPPKTKSKKKGNLLQIKFHVTSNNLQHD